MILLFNIQIGLTEANVDNIANLGGLTVGIIMGFAIAENDDRRERSQSFIDFIKRTNYKNKCGIIFLFSYLLVFILVFYLLIEVWLLDIKIYNLSDKTKTNDRQF